MALRRLAQAALVTFLVAAPPLRSFAADYDVASTAAIVIHHLLVEGTVDGSPWVCGWQSRYCCTYPNEPTPGIAVVEDSLGFSLVGDPGAQSASLDAFSVGDSGISGSVSCEGFPGPQYPPPPVTVHFEVSDFSVSIPPTVWEVDPFAPDSDASTTVIESFRYRVLINNVPIGSGTVSRELATTYRMSRLNQDPATLSFGLAAFGPSGFELAPLNSFVDHVGGRDLDLSVYANGATVSASFGLSVNGPSPACLSIDECRSALAGSLPDAGADSSGRSRRAASKLASLEGKAGIALDQLRYGRARRLLSRLLGRARKADSRGILRVPVAPIEDAVSGLLALLPEHV